MLDPAPSGLERLGFIFVVCCAPLVLFSCKTLEQANPNNTPASLEPQAPPMPRGQGPDGDEAQLKHLQQFQQRILTYCKDRNFTAATRELAWLEQASKQVTEQTQAHPDYEDIAAATTRLRPFVERSIAQDQAARRQSAIAALIQKGQQIQQDSAILLRDIERQPIERNELTTLEELIALLQSNAQDGQPFGDDQQYNVFAQKQQQWIEQLQQRHTSEQARFQLQQQLQQALGQAKSLEKRSESPSSATLRQWSQHYLSCNQWITRYRTLYPTNQHTPFQVGLGPESLEQIHLRCEQAYRLAEQRLARYDWEQSVTTTIQAVERTWTPYQQASLPEEKFQAATALLPHLQHCAEQHSLALPQPNRDVQLPFTTPFGSLTVHQWLQQCRQQADKIALQLPQLAWLMQAHRHIQALPKLQTTPNPPSDGGPAEQHKRTMIYYTSQLGAIQSCVETSQQLQTHSDAQPNIPIETPLGAMTIKQLHEQCTNLQQTYQAQLANYLRQQQSSQFLPSCKADEITIVQQEGVPSAILPTEFGRTFIYLQPSGQERRRFHFNEQGIRQEITLLWQHAMEAELQPLQSALQALSHPTLGQQEQTWQQALALLERCQQEGPLGSHHPGYQANQLFQTWFGAKTYPALRQACAEHANKLRQESHRRAWRQRIDQAYQRYLHAVALAQQAKQQTHLAEQIEQLQLAEGGYLACSDTLTYLQHVDGAIPNYQVVTTDSNTKVGPLLKQCKLAQSQTSKQLQSLRRTLQSQQYAQTLQADEQALCLQRGLPDSIQSHTGGRLWQYGNQRFAFDRQGRRTPEQALGAAQGAPTRPGP